MDPSSPEAREHLRQALNNEIKALEESTRAAKYRRNALAPVSRLPPEILTEIFSILSSSAGDDGFSHWVWLHVPHVCHNWRETALNCPHLWNHINFNRLSSVGITGILARAKMAPLHLEAKIIRWNDLEVWFGNVGRQVEAHISHTLHLSLSGPFQTVLERLVSPAPALKSLSLRNVRYKDDSLPQLLIPYTLFNLTVPKLMNLELVGCDISWKWPLLKGLRNLALAHLIFPALTSLYMRAEYHNRKCNDVGLLIPHVARNTRGPQDTAPLQSISMRGWRAHVEMSAWTVPGADVKDCVSITIRRSPRVLFTATPATDTALWRYKPELRILNVLLMHLPTNAISTLTAKGCTLDKEFWLSHASSLAMLKRVCLDCDAVKAFRRTLAEDSPSNGPRFPRLTKLIFR